MSQLVALLGGDERAYQLARRLVALNRQWIARRRQWLALIHRYLDRALPADDQGA